MFKKIDLWLVFLLLIIFLVVLILYGSLLRYHYNNGKSFPFLRNLSVVLASVPSNVKKIYMTKQLDLNMPDYFLSHKHLPRYKRFKDTTRDELLILPRYDGDLKRSVVEIVDLNTFEVLHTYKHDINNMLQKIDLSKRENKFVKRDDSEIRFLYLHPLVLEDGSLIATSENSPVFKIDFCSNLVWINDNETFHHSKMLDFENNIWIGASMFPYSKYIQKYRKEYGFRDDSIAKINNNGELIFNKSITEILIENKIINEDAIMSSDPIHLNDIEPALTSSKYWEKGDIFLSIRKNSAIVHYRPKTNKVLNYIKGPYYLQHDVDIISNKEISIFNNNSIMEGSKYSEIIIYNFEDKTFKKKFNDDLRNNNVHTFSQGLSEILDDGSMLVEEQNHGRIIFFDKFGNKEWEFVNKDSKNNNYFTSWSRILKNKKTIKNIKKQVELNKC